jgi:hypothetical protein
MEQSQTNQSKASNSSMAMIDFSLSSPLSLSLSLSLSLCFFFAIFILSYATQYPISLSKNDTILKKAKMTERIALKGALSLVQINTHTHTQIYAYTYNTTSSKKIISFLNPKKLNRHVLTLIFDFFKKNNCKKRVVCS